MIAQLRDMMLDLEKTGVERLFILTNQKHNYILFTLQHYAHRARSRFTRTKLYEQEDQIKRGIIAALQTEASKHIWSRCRLRCQSQM